MRQEGNRLVILKRFLLNNFRTLGPKEELEFGNLTTIVGPNNAGKSNLFRAINLLLKNMKGSGSSGNLSGETTSYWPRNRVEGDIAFSAEFELLPEEREKLIRGFPVGEKLLQSCDVHTHVSFSSPVDNKLEIVISMNISGKTFKLKESMDTEERKFIERILEFIVDSVHNINIGDVNSPLYLLKELQKDLSKRTQFKTLRQNYRDVGISDANIAIEENAVRFEHENDFVCDLENMGNGSVSSLALILECFTKYKKILLVEEPETGLHANGQQFLADFLVSNSAQNQILLTTHSPIFVDTVAADSVYLVTKDSKSQISNWRKLSPEDLSSLRNALGLRNSHVFLPDIVVYVDGKTDLPVFEKWFRLYCAIYHYPESSIQFLPVYGSGNVSHALEMELRGKLGKEFRFFYICDKDKGKTENGIKKTIKQSLEAKLGSNDKLWSQISPRIHVLIEGEVEDYLAKSYKALAKFLKTTEQKIKQKISSYPSRKSGFSILNILSMEFRTNQRYKKSESQTISNFLEAEELPPDIVELFKSLSSC